MIFSDAGIDTCGGDGIDTISGSDDNGTILACGDDI
jgi:hypothetical protein